MAPCGLAGPVSIPDLRGLFTQIESLKILRKFRKKFAIFVEIYTQ